MNPDRIPLSVVEPAAAFRGARPFRFKAAGVLAMVLLGGLGLWLRALLGLSGGGFRGGDVPSGSGPRESESLFADVTAGSGIDFTHNNGAGGRLLLPEIMGAGGALFDYDPPAWPSAAPGRPGAEVWHDPQTTR